MSGLRSSSHYSYLFKVRVIGEVLSGSLSKEEASKKYGIKGHSTISKWIRKLDSGHTAVSVMDSKDRTSYEKRIRELEDALRFERLRTSSLEEMISIAEEELKTSIRKSPVPNNRINEKSVSRC